MKENLEEYYKKASKSETITVFILLAGLVYEYFLFFLFGDPTPDNQGFGWMVIVFGGWVLYLPILSLIVFFCVLYIRTIFLRIDYFKICHDPLLQEKKISRLFDMSRFIYYFSFILLLFGSFKRRALILGLIMLGGDVFLQRFLFNKVAKVDHLS